MTPADRTTILTPRWNPIPYELRIGVTGHRSLDNGLAVEAAVHDALSGIVTTLGGASSDPLGPHGSPQSRIDRFDRLLSRLLSGISHAMGPALDLMARPFSSTWHWPRVPVSPARPSLAQETPLKLTVISCLAKGADQIVARVVCRLVTNKEDRNRYLEAVLPFAPDVYKSDNDADTFGALLALDAGRLNTQPSPTIIFPDFVHAGGSSRPVSPEDAYAAAGRHMVGASEMVVAVWDPRRAERAGGTAETVRYAIAQGRAVVWINPADLEAGAALLRFEPAQRRGVPEPRKVRGLRGRIATRWRRVWHEQQPPLPAGSWCFAAGAHRYRVEPVPIRAKALSRNFHRLAAYNRDGAVDVSRLTAEWRRRATELGQVFARYPVGEAAATTVVNVLLPHYVRADYLAGRYRALRDFSARLWPMAAALVVSLMAFQIVFLPGHYWIALVELAVLVLGYASYRVSLHDAWHAKWLNDRRVAEGLRGAMFAALLPDDEQERVAQSRRVPVTGTATSVQNPLPFYNPATAWFVDSLKRMVAKERRAFARDLTLKDANQRRAVADLLREAWVQAQRVHHEHKAASQARIAARGKRVRLSMIGLLTFVAILHALGVGHAGESGVVRIDLWIGFATVALPAWAAAFHVMLSLDDHERLAERSTHMAQLLERLEDEFAHVDTLDDLRTTVRQADRIMDLETAEWAESLMDRKPEFTG